MKEYISLIDKETKIKSNKIPIEDVIYNQNEIVFIFPNEEMGEETLPYKDFLFYRNDYELWFEYD